MDRSVKRCILKMSFSWSSAFIYHFIDLIITSAYNIHITNFITSSSLEAKHFSYYLIPQQVSLSFYIYSAVKDNYLETALSSHYLIISWLS